MKNQKNATIGFLILLTVGFFLLRIYKIDLISLYPDEASHYVHYNQSLFRHPESTVGLLEQSYSSLFSLTWLFGLNPLGARLPSVIIGALLPVLMWLLSRQLSGNKKVMVLSSIIIGFLPWSFMISRLGHTHIPLLVALIIIHLTLFFKASFPSGYALSIVPLLVSLYVYQTASVVFPAVIFIPFYLAIKAQKKRLQKKIVILTIIVLGMVSVIITKRFDFFSIAARGLDLAIWRDVNTPYEIDRYRALSWNSEPSLFSFGLPPEQFANKLVYNRAMANISIFTRNYLSFFSPDWLFLKGDAILRHSTGQVGAFYPFLLPFMFYGAFKFFSTADKKARLTFLVWILVSPIPAAITKDGAGYLLRAVTLLPFLTYFCALGLVESFSIVRKKWRWSYGILVALIGIYSAYHFFYGYFHVYPALSARAYEYGFKELSDFQMENGEKTILIIWDGYYPVIQFLFWQQTPFSKYQKMKYTPIVIGDTTLWKTLPNLYFTAPKDVENVQEFIDIYQPDYLVLPDKYFVKYSDDLIDLTSEKVKEIPYPDKTTAFTIYSIE